MNRKFSLAYLTIPGTDPVKQIDIATEVGYDYVSLRPIPMHLPNEPLFQFDKDIGLFRKIEEALKKNNIRLLDIELARVRKDLKVEDYESAFSAGAELGATDVISSVWTDDKAYYYNEFAKICDLAAKYDLRVNLEFVTYSGITTLEEAVNLLNGVQRPNAHLLIDTLHAHRSKVSPKDLEKIEQSKFGLIHLCDGPKPIPGLDDPEMIGVAREGRLYPGDGGIDLKGMLKAMPTNPISIELPNSKEMKNRGALGHARQCLIKARQYLAENDIE
ncbi:MAG: sugar phosphate isomerase/epimerase [Firmicutes bacterium]|nr:sugar phosphate isomerase/epimerase [Bacillota bacterium]